MTNELMAIKEAYDEKMKSDTTRLGVLQKLAEEASELAAAINKYLTVEYESFPSRSDIDKAWDNIIEEAGDVMIMLKNAKLSLDTADSEDREALLDRMVFKACRFIGRPDSYWNWKSQKSITKQESDDAASDQKEPDIRNLSELLKQITERPELQPFWWGRNMIVVPLLHIDHDGEED